jgi:hypothetical protein
MIGDYDFCVPLFSGYGTPIFRITVTLPYLTLTPLCLPLQFRDVPQAVVHYPPSRRSREDYCSLRGRKVCALPS